MTDSSINLFWLFKFDMFLSPGARPGDIETALGVGRIGIIPGLITSQLLAEDP